MVSGKPYISTNNATMNAENALKERQSRFVCGFAKLKAKMIKTKELMMTSDHNPYAGTSSIFSLLKQLFRSFRYDPYVGHRYFRDLHDRHETDARVDRAVTK